MSTWSGVTETYTKSGLVRYVAEVRHDALKKYQVIKADNPYIVEQKARNKMAQWDEMWEKRKAAQRKQADRKTLAKKREEKKADALARSTEAKEELDKLGGILRHTLAVDDKIDWESLKDKSKFGERKPAKPGSPKEPEPPKIPDEPNRTDAKYRVKSGLLDRIFASRLQTKQEEANRLFASDDKKWHDDREAAIIRHDDEVKKHKSAVDRQNKEFEVTLKRWEEKREEFLKHQAEANAAIDAKKQKYLDRDPEAISDYCDMVLSGSEYPDYFPQSYELSYNPDNGIVIVDYQLPSVDDIPTLREVKYVQSNDEFTEKHISDAERNRLYDELIYQIALRTIHELFEADVVDALKSVVFNGFVHSIDRATGKETDACILSIQANKEEFEEISLEHVDVKACFKKLKGVGSSKLHSLTPVAPLVRMDREDSRFVDSYGVVDELGEEDNLAAMDWEDFEHLIREMFEKEFAQAGGEVKVTRASRDGGIDAVVFDPDPIRGGKIVVQAKRYTNTVGVSAVRDLFGSVMNEGANKGILVSTADYGPDAYEFAKGKPLVLLSGNNLLHLLEKHGHKAKIDLKEAKRILAEREKEASK